MILLIHLLLVNIFGSGKALRANELDCSSCNTIRLLLFLNVFGSARQVKRSKVQIPKARTWSSTQSQKSRP